MENYLFIETKIEKDTTVNLGELIEKVFKSGRDNGMDLI